MNGFYKKNGNFSFIQTETPFFQQNGDHLEQTAAVQQENEQNM